MFINCKIDGIKKAHKFMVTLNGKKAHCQAYRNCRLIFSVHCQANNEMTLDSRIRSLQLTATDIVDDPK